MTTPTETFTVGKIGDMLRQSMPPFEWFRQEFVLGQTITGHNWIPCYIRVGITNDDRTNLEVSIIIQQNEDSPVDLEYLLYGVKVVLWRNDDDQITLGNLHSEGLPAGTFSANIDVPLAQITPESYLTIA